MHPRTTRTLRWSHPATLAALLHSSLFLLTLSPAPSSTHALPRAVLSFSSHTNPFFVNLPLDITAHYQDIIRHGITKLSRSPMITCDQVVSGGSAERTTKMAAAPAADSVCSPPGFSTLSSCFLLSPVSLSFFYSAFLSLSFSRYHSVFYSLLRSSNSLPDLSSQSFPPLSRLTPCSEGEDSECRRTRSGAR